MSDYMQPPGPAGTTYIQHERRACKSRIVWMNKEEAIKLMDCIAALIECVRALETAQPYVESSGWTRHRDAEIAQVESAIANARKALGE